MNYQVSEYDSATYVVYDSRTNKEICVCSEFENEDQPPKERAEMIAEALNERR